MEIKIRQTEEIEEYVPNDSKTKPQRRTECSRDNLPSRVQCNDYEDAQQTLERIDEHRRISIELVNKEPNRAEKYN